MFERVKVWVVEIGRRPNYCLQWRDPVTQRLRTKTTPIPRAGVRSKAAAERLAGELKAAGHGVLHGVVHSIAFANYSEGFKPFHETRRADFLQATAVSAFSLVEVARALRPLLAPDASVVTIGISSLLVTPDNYGYMGPIKAALESSVRFLAKSFSAHSAVRFNAVGSGKEAQLGCGCAGAAVVVRVKRECGEIAAGQVARNPLDLVGVDIRRRVFHRGRKVEDDFVFRSWLPDFGHGLANLEGEIEFRAGEALGRVFEADARTLGDERLHFFL